MKSKTATRSVKISAVMGLLLLLATPCTAGTYNVGGKRLTLKGLFSQTVQGSILGDHWDNEQDINSLLFNALVEGDYRPSDTFSIYGSTGVNVDWIYAVKDSDESWNRKQFDKSDELFVEDEWWQILREFHLTWMPGDFMFRIGKQQVRWGELEVFRVNDLINPLYIPRGYSEVELEYLFMAIPLVRTQYDSPYAGSWLSHPGLQFMFNPNADHIPDFAPYLGNDVAGIWAANLVYDLGYGPWRIGRQDLTILNEPGSFDSDFFEYGVRVYGSIKNTLVSVMGFYGRENTAVTTLGADVTDDSFTVIDDDGIPIVNLADVGTYPRQKFVGFGTATELPIGIPTLGNFNPVFRLEGSYQFDKVYWDGNAYFNSLDPTTYYNFENSLVEADTLTWGANLEYKIRTPWRKAYISLFGEIQQSYILNYEDAWAPGINETTTNWYVSVSTTFIRAKLIPMFEWYVLDGGGFKQWAPSIKYVFNEKWNIKLKASIFDGGDQESYWGYQNKDYVALKFSYQFN